MIDSFRGDYTFLSNFYPCYIKYNHITYPSVEHFYVAMKFSDDQLINGHEYNKQKFREMISHIESPGMAKKIGQKVILKNWDSKKLLIMEWAIRQKFKDEKLKALLLSTGDKKLIEGNKWNDTFWGVCDNKGKNHLGKILMKVRDELSGKKGLEEILG